jgi:hypothetical protein
LGRGADFFLPLDFLLLAALARVFDFFLLLAALARVFDFFLPPAALERGPDFFLPLFFAIASSLARSLMAR